MDLLSLPRLEFGLGHAKLGFCLLQGLFLRIGRSSGTFHLVYRDELPFKQWLKAAQIIARISPLGFGAGDTLPCIFHACPSLIFSRNIVRDIGLGRLYASLGHRDTIDLRRDAPPFVSNLTFQSSLI